MRRFIRNLFTKPVTAPITESRKPARTRLALEGLEAREVLNATLSGSVLNITGTPGNVSDAFEIRAANANSVTVSDNGRTIGDFPFSSPVLSRINVDGLGGNDTLTVDSLPALVNNGQLHVSNVEQVDVGQATGILFARKFTLAGIRSEVFVDNPIGLNIRGDADSAGKVVSVDGESVTGLAPKPISYAFASGGHTLDVRTGDGNDVIHVHDALPAGQMRVFSNGGNDFIDVTATDAALQVFSGDGDDTLDVAPLDESLSSIAGPVSFDGGAGNDSVIVNDQNAVPFGGFSSIAYSATVGADRITRNETIKFPLSTRFQSTSVGYTGVESVAFSAPSTAIPGSGRVSVTGTSAPTVVNAGLQNVVVGDGGKLDGIRGVLTVNRDALGGTLTIDDSAQTNSTRYALGANSVTEPGRLIGTSAAAVILGGPIHVPPVSLFPRLTINFNDNVQTVRVLGGVKGDNFDVAQMRSGGRQYQIDGGGGLDTLTGPNQDNFFALTGANSGSLNGIGFGYSNVESLAGNAKNDTFQFANGNIDGFLSGGGGNFDTLDYSLLGVASNVNLATGSAHDVGGGATGRVSGVEDVIGGRAADTIVGDGGNNILIGNGGNDSLEGGGGFDLLVGGDGKDDLSDTAGRAIYIGGKVAGTLQLTSGQQAVLTEWARTDLPGSAQQQFVKKVADLKSGVLGGAVRLDRSTLEADGKVDTLNPNPAPTAFDLFVLDRQDQFKFATNVPSAVELAREIIV